MYLRSGDGDGRIEGCELSPELQQELKDTGTPATLEIGAILYAEGQPLQSIALVQAGRLKLTKTSAHGKTLLVRIVGRNEIVALSAAIMRTRHLTSVETMERAQVLLFEPGDFLQRMQRHAELALYAARSLSSGYHAVIDEAYRLALSTTVASRIAHLLLELAAANNHGPQAHPAFSIPLRHEDIAFMTGTSRESVTRTLSDFRRRRILSMEGTTVTILLKKDLEQML